MFLLALSSFGLLACVHLHDAASHHCGDCVVCQLLSTTGEDVAVVETPVSSHILDRAERVVSNSSLVRSHTDVASHSGRGPPLCA